MSEDVTVAEDSNTAVQEPDKDYFTFGDREPTYRNYLERLKTEFGHFLSLAEMGRTKSSAALKSRKQSIVLRKILKEYREISIENDSLNKADRKKTEEQIEQRTI